MSTLKEQFNTLKKEARKRGLKIKKDKRLNNCPYRAMHKYAGIELGQPYIKDAITYTPKTAKNKKRLVMDTRHELIEFDHMRKGLKYKQAHKIANRKQRTVNYYEK